MNPVPIIASLSFLGSDIVPSRRGRLRRNGKRGVYQHDGGCRISGCGRPTVVSGLAGYEWRRLLYLLHHQHFFGVVDLREFDLDYFPHGGLDISSDEGGFDGQFAVSAIDEHAQLHARRAAVGQERFQRCSSRTTGKEHIIDDHDVLIFDGHAEVGMLDYGRRPNGGEVVAIESYVESSDGKRST